MYGVSKMAGARNHLVMTFGAYVELVQIEPSSTAATSIVIHGGNSGLSAPMPSDVATLSLAMNTTVKELKIFGGRPVVTDAVSANGDVRFERCTIDSLGRGITTGAKLTLIDTTIVGDSDAMYAVLLFSTARLIMDRVVVRGPWIYGISSSSQGTTVEVTNLLISGTKNLAIDLPQTNGTIAFSTIADSGTDIGTGPRAVLCSSGLTIRSSIIWAPGKTSREPVAGCNLATTIAGPTPVVGGDNMNPGFAGASDYHLSATSPARDRVDTGPALDFEGDPRPRGAKFDVGADEAP